MGVPAEPSPAGAEVGPYRDMIRQWLIEDRRRRETAARPAHLPAPAGKTRLKGPNRPFAASWRLRRELEMDVLEQFFVLSSGPDGAGRRGQAKVMLAGVPTVVHLFCLRLHYSGVAFVWASLHEKRRRSWRVRAGVCVAGRRGGQGGLDNLRRWSVRSCRARAGSRRTFRGLRSHYVFDSVFANPGRPMRKARGKSGGVVRRTFTPVGGRVHGRAERRLLAWCEQGPNAAGAVEEEQQRCGRCLPVCSNRASFVTCRLTNCRW